MFPHPNMTRLAQTLALLGILLLLAPLNLLAQAKVNAERSFQVSIRYEDVLKKLEGEAATRLMFASQDVHLLTYQPNKSEDNSDSEQGITRASIEISGSSCEFGIMRYRLSVVASAKQTQIDVQLLHPVGMLRQQRYLYRIVPINDTQTSIQICHDLDVVLKHSRLKLVNSMIKKVTYRKACEEVVSLTNRMSNCVSSLVLASDPTKRPDADASSDADDDIAPDADSQSPSSKDSEPTQPSLPAEPSALQEPSAHNVTPQPLEPLVPAETSVPTEPSALAEPSASTPDLNPPTTAVPASESITSMEPSSPSDLPPVDASISQPPSSPSPILSQTDDAPSSTEHTPPVTTNASDSSPSSTSPTEAPQTTASADTSKPDVKAKSPSLRITVEGVSQSTGTVRIAIFHSAEEYRLFDARKEEAKQGKAFRKVEVKTAAGRKATYEFTDVPPGKYAIAAFHDQDGNKKLNASLLGLPNEPYGFSRNARGTLGAPKFEDAIVEFDEQHTAFSFRLK